MQTPEAANITVECISGTRDGTPCTHQKEVRHVIRLDLFAGILGIRTSALLKAVRSDEKLAGILIPHSR